MNSYAVAMCSGLGNAVFMLPVVKALKVMRNRVCLYVHTDFPTADLWRRCVYADEVIEAPGSTNGHTQVFGEWRPEEWRGPSRYKHFRVLAPYRMSEWQSNMRVAGQVGWRDFAPDVSDWCRSLDRTIRWDVGIVPGSKPGVWLRKRWSGISAVASHFISEGLRVAVFGRDEDDIGSIPGEAVRSPRIELLPDLLAGCRVIIGTDSGPVHLASSLGVPTVIIYTATSEIKGEPVNKTHKKIMASLPCRPCQSTMVWHGCKDWKCRHIDPHNAIRAAEEFLNRG